MPQNIHAFEQNFVGNVVVICIWLWPIKRVHFQNVLCQLPYVLALEEAFGEPQKANKLWLETYTIYNRCPKARLILQSGLVLLFYVFSTKP